MQLGLEVGEHGGVAVVTVRGEIDLGSAHRVRDAVLELLHDGHRRLVLDLAAVEFLDSVGLGMLVASLKRTRALGGELALVVTRERVRRPFEVAGVLAAFGVHPTVAAAVAALPTADGAGR
jgi:anti-sigma B factor antagonist